MVRRSVIGFKTKLRYARVARVQEAEVAAANTVEFNYIARDMRTDNHVINAAPTESLAGNGQLFTCLTENDIVLLLRRRVIAFQPETVVAVFACRRNVVVFHLPDKDRSSAIPHSRRVIDDTATLVFELREQRQRLLRTGHSQNNIGVTGLPDKAFLAYHGYVISQSRAPFELIAHG